MFPESLRFTVKPQWRLCLHVCKFQAPHYGFWSTSTGRDSSESTKHKESASFVKSFEICISEDFAWNFQKSKFFKICFLMENRIFD